MPYIPHTEEDTKAMLDAIGVSKIEELFDAVPQHILQTAEGYQDIESGLSEQETNEKISNIAQRNNNPKTSFLGGGYYNHYIPSHVLQLAGRSEFYTAYTPYQPEISQGILQAIFEYQSFITRLTGMDATNASMYDGSSAAGEVCLMVSSITRRNKILVGRNMNPQYREVMQTYCDGKDLELVEVPFDMDTGKIDGGRLEEMLNEEVAGVFMQSPNFFGVIEDVKLMSEKIQAAGALTVQVITEGLSLGALTPPGENNVDIVVGEGQSFGLPISGGGPSFGFLATTEKLMRKLPGRIVGETEDSEGKKCYVLTLQAREQHIRREKASSNICTNQALCALVATIYLSTLGKNLKELALMNHKNALHFQKKLNEKGWTRGFAGTFFNEFVVNVGDARAAIKNLREQDIAAGINLGDVYPEMEGKILVCVTEMNTQAQMKEYLENI